jgi:hypothetical protein
MQQLISHKRKRTTDSHYYYPLLVDFCKQIKEVFALAAQGREAARLEGKQVLQEFLLTTVEQHVLDGETPQKTKKRKAEQGEEAQEDKEKNKKARID